MFDFTSGPYSGIGTPQQSIGFPQVLTLGDVQLPDDSLTIGVNGAAEPIGVDLTRSPHVLVSAATGGGKSAIVRSLSAQFLRQGGVVTFLDVKRHSHRWAKELAPNVAYAASVPEIGNALVQLGKEVHKRNVIVDRWKGEVETAPVGPSIMVPFEEINSTMAHLRDLDKRVPNGQYKALDAFADIANMGRAVRVHLVATAQLASFRAMGGSEIVENFDTRILSRYSTQAWRWLASDCGQALSAPEEPGRVIVCHGGKARETQCLYLTEREAGDLVLASPKAQALAHHLSTFRAPAVWRSAVRGITRGES